MAYMFTAPLDQTVGRTLPASHPGNKLMRHYSPLTAGRNVYIVAGVATSNPGDYGAVTRTFFGGHEAEEVTAAEKAILEAGGFTVEEV